MENILDTFFKLDTPLEWAESAAAVFLLFIGFGIGNFVASKVFKLLSVISLFSVLYYVLYQITQSYWTDWKEIVIIVLLIGVLTSFLAVPFSIAAEFEDRISKLEQE